MSDLSSRDQLFIGKLTEIVNAHLSDENFGAEKLAGEAGMSRTRLHRRLKSITNIDISQFIKEIRLNKAMDMLKNEDVTASEVAFRVGFNSPTYFNKCFHEFFGFPPGKMKTGDQVFPVTTSATSPGLKKKVEKQPMHSRWINSPVIWGMLIIAVAVVIFIFSYPLKTIRRGSLEKLKSSGEKISVAVMPFQNMTNDTNWNVWQEGIQENLIFYLSNSEVIKTREAESINTLLQSKNLIHYTSLTPSVASAISVSLNANVFIYGNIQQAGSKVRVNAKLIDSKTEDVIRSFQIEGPSREEIIFNISDSLSRMVKDFLIISILKKDNAEYQDITLTNSPEAYRYYLLGKSAYYKKDNDDALHWLNQALSIDPDFTWAMRFIVGAYNEKGDWEKAKEWSLRWYKKTDRMPDKEKLWASYQYSFLFQTPNESIKILKQLLEIDDQNPPVYFSLGLNYSHLHQYDNAILAYEKALNIYKKWDSKPMWVLNYHNLGFSYHMTGQYKKENKLYKKAELHFPDNPFLIRRQAILALSEGKIKAGNEYIEKIKKNDKENSLSEGMQVSSLGLIYYQAGIMDKAVEYFKLALSLEPENPEIIHNLAYVLIKSELDIDGALEIIEKALTLSPDHHNYLYVKGWGLYKKGKYQEALECLQRSWDIRIDKTNYNHEVFLTLEAAKKAVDSQTNN